jgi:hypothetical protein
MAYRVHRSDTDHFTTKRALVVLSREAGWRINRQLIRGPIFPQVKEGLYDDSEIANIIKK